MTRFLAEQIYHLFSRDQPKWRQKPNFGDSHARCSHFQSYPRRGGRFAGANQGNIAVLFGIAGVPILTFVGAAIDYTRANSARSSMQAALDSTALMVSKDLSDGTITTSQINAKAQAYFTALYTNTDAQSVSVSATYTASSSTGSTIQVNGSGIGHDRLHEGGGLPEHQLQHQFDRGLGQRADARRRWRSTTRDRWPRTAKSARCGPPQEHLIDQLSALAKNPGDVYISIVPFAKDVNVGASNYNQTWIDWTDWDRPDERTPDCGPGRGNCHHDQVFYVTATTLDAWDLHTTAQRYPAGPDTQTRQILEPARRNPPDLVPAARVQDQNG